jgi:hypothetical protein
MIQEDISKSLKSSDESIFLQGNPQTTIYFLPDNSFFDLHSMFGSLEESRESGGVRRRSRMKDHSMYD